MPYYDPSYTFTPKGTSPAQTVTPKPTTPAQTVTPKPVTPTPKTITSKPNDPMVLLAEDGTELMTESEYLLTREN